MMKTYQVQNGFWLKGQFIAPAPEGEPARTIDLTERDARYPLLAGDIATPAVAAEAPSNAG